MADPRWEACAFERQGNEVQHLRRGLEKRLQQAEVLAGPKYGVAGIAWVRNPDRQGIKPADYPAVEHWSYVIVRLPAVQRHVVLADHRLQGQILEAER